MKTKSPFSTVAVLAVLSAGLVSANAASYSPIDFGDRATIDLNTLYQGAQYPQQGGAEIQINGVDFKLPTCGANCSAAVTPPGGANGNLPAQAGHPGVIGQLGAGPVLGLPIWFAPINGATTAYALVNSMFGTVPSAIGSLIFIPQSAVVGDTYNPNLVFTYNLVEGENVRDHYQGSYNNDIDASNVLGTAVFQDGQYVVVDPNSPEATAPGTVRLDALVIDLQGKFLNDPLVGIALSVDSTIPTNGLPILAAAVTIGAENGPGTVPVPAAWSLMLGGLGGIWATMRHRNKRRTASAQAAS